MFLSIFIGTLKSGQSYNVRNANNVMSVMQHLRSCMVFAESVVHNYQPTCTT